METNVIGSVPEFTSDEEVGTEQVDQSTEAVVDETIETETETPTEPAAVETPVEPEIISQPNVDTGKQVHGLLQEREKLLKEIQSLRGQRREIKQDQLIKVDQKLEDLNDVNPEDTKLIERVMRAKGMVTKDEAQNMFYDAVKQDEVSKFLEKYPEYKPENDQNDLNWNALQREFSEFARPTDPKRISYLLEKAHKGIVRPPSDRSVPAKQQQIKVASVGSGGTQRSSSRKSLDPDTLAQLRAGGFTDEDIKNMESRL